MSIIVMDAVSEVVRRHDYHADDLIVAGDSASNLDKHRPSDSEQNVTLLADCSCI